MKPANELDQILFSAARLKILAFLRTNGSAEFTQIRDELNLPSGNLSIQIKKLKEAGYLEIQKSFKDNYPLTVCRISNKGNEALQDFKQKINDLLA